MSHPTIRLVRGKDFVAEPFHPASRLLHRELFDAEATAATLRAEAAADRAAAAAELAAARQQAAELLAATERRAAAEVEAARQEAIAAVRTQWRSTLDGLTDAVATQRQHYGEQLARAAFLLARTVLGIELTTHPESIRALLAAVLQHARDKQQVEVRMAPLRLQQLQLDPAAIAAMAPGLERVRLVGDPELRPDAIEVRTERGVYAASVRRELQRLRDQLGARIATALAQPVAGDR
jgi:flagellar biosynthesis/type III secretory pathway protein FliH